VRFLKHPLNQGMARTLRASTRATRPEIEGHRFSYAGLKELWATEDREHVVLTHDGEDGWQYWAKGPDGGWELIGVHPTREEAQGAARLPQPSPLGEPGTYFVAHKPEGRSIRVHCTTPEAVDTLTAIFQKMGYETAVEEVR
jgi:hypothetical protein